MTHRHGVAMHVGCAGARTSRVISDAHSWPLRPSSSRLTNKERAQTNTAAPPGRQPRQLSARKTAVPPPLVRKDVLRAAASPARRSSPHTSTNCSMSASPGSVPESGRRPARSGCRTAGRRTSPHPDAFRRRGSARARRPGTRHAPEDVELRTTSSIGPSICRLSGSPPLSRSANAFIAASPRSNKGIFTAVS